MALAEVIIANKTISVIIISILITLFTTLVHKWLTNQEHLKNLKARQKEINKEMKKSKDPKIIQELQLEAMKLTGVMFKSSMRPLFVIFIPIILLLSWGNSNIAYYPLTPGEEFSIDLAFQRGLDGSTASVNVPEGLAVLSDVETTVEKNTASWDFKGSKGKYLVEFFVENEDSKDKFLKEITIDDGIKYSSVRETCGEPRTGLSKKLCFLNKPNKEIKSVMVGNEKIIYLNLFGWKLGWLGAYIIFSIFSSMIIRKILKVA